MTEIEQNLIMGIKKNALGDSKKFAASSGNAKKKAAGATRFKRDVAIRDRQGKTIFQMGGVGAPTGWSDTAVSIVASKYFRYGESSVEELVERVLLALRREMRRQWPKKYHREADRVVQFLQSALMSQRFFFNSPVWFNAGLSEKHKVASPQHMWFWNSKKNSVQQNTAQKSHPQLSACFILSLEDSLQSIFELASTEAMIFKYGSGAGTNFSNLRAKGESLATGGSSSGLISFLEVLDKGAGAIRSGGTTRRAAKMVCLDVDHPDILEFLHWKPREEEKARVLMQAGFGSGMDSEALRTVSGQNANLSVRLSDHFMNAVENDQTWKLRWRTKKSSASQKEISARQIFSEVAQSAWQCADPGVQFIDTIQKWHTCKKTGPIRASNPCSEFLFLDDTACNLASINLLQFLQWNENSQTHEFQWEEFAKLSTVVLQSLEVWVDHAGYPTQKVAENSHQYRPLGLGICGLGAVLMRLGMPYGSSQASNFAASIMALQTGVAYIESARLARALGPYKGFRANRSAHLGVVAQHRANAKKHLAKIRGTAEEKIIPIQLIQEIWDEALLMGKKFGFRNSQVTALAPTGTIGLAMDCETTGIEPEFSLVRRKSLAGGGDLVFVSQSVGPALRQLRYTEKQIALAEFHLKTHGNLWECDWIQKEHKEIFACANELSADSHLQMLAALQPFVSGGISKTVNLPAQVRPQEIESLYFQAWKLGLKSVAIYRDGSKATQVLQTEGGQRQKTSEGLFPQSPLCTECGMPTELAGSCWQCKHCGAVTACG